MKGEVFCDGVDLVTFENVGEGYVFMFQESFQDVFPEDDAFISFLIFDPVPDLVTGPWRLCEFEPVFARMVSWGGYDLNGTIFPLTFAPIHLLPTSEWML